MKVEIIDIMGNDLSVVNAARVSYAKVKEKFDNIVETLVDINLISNENELLRLITQNDKKPVLFKAEKDIEVNLCGCKQSENAPYCNGSHLNV